MSLLLPATCNSKLSPTSIDFFLNKNWVRSLEQYTSLKEVVCAIANADWCCVVDNTSGTFDLDKVLSSCLVWARQFSLLKNFCWINCCLRLRYSHKKKEYEFFMNPLFFFWFSHFKGDLERLTFPPFGLVWASSEKNREGEFCYTFITFYYLMCVIYV